jgi:urea transport system ATP-binding protein
MMDIITGKTRPDRGTVFFGSTIDLLRHNEPEIAQLGIGRKFQKPTVFEQLTVFENLELALKTHKGVKPACSSGSTARRATAWPRCCTPSTWRAACTAGRRAQPRPEAVAGDRHAADAGPQAAAARRTGGRHDRRGNRAHGRAVPAPQGQAFADGGGARHAFIATISEKVTVLCEGSVLAEGTLAQVQADERVIEVYLGR